MNSKLKTALSKYCNRNKEDRRIKEELLMFERIMIENDFDTYLENYQFIYDLDIVLLNLDYSTPTREKMLIEFNMAKCYD